MNKYFKLICIVLVVWTTGGNAWANSDIPQVLIQDRDEARAIFLEALRDLDHDAFNKFMGIDIVSGLEEVLEEDSKKFFDTEDCYYFLVQYSLNGLPVPALTYRGHVDKYTGETEVYMIPLSAFSIGTLSAPEPGAETISEEEARQNYIDEALVLQYYAQSDAGRAVPVYWIKALNRTGIDAETGEYMGRTRTLRYGGEYGAAELDGAKVADIIATNDLITKEQAIAEMERLYGRSFENLDLDDMYLCKMYEEPSVYLWGHQYGDVMIDARTGKLSYLREIPITDNFGPIPHKQDIKEELDVDSCKAIAEEFMDREFGENQSEIELYEIHELDEGAMLFVYSRMVNGIPFFDNGVVVAVDKKTGAITEYEKRWYHDMEFVSFSKDDLVTPEAAMAALEGRSEFKESYVLDTMTSRTFYVSLFPSIDPGYSERYQVAYALSPEPRYPVEATTGRLIAPCGCYYDDDPIPHDYEDIEGHWSEGTVLRLLEDGYYLNRFNFGPDIAMTASDFFQLIEKDTGDRVATDEKWSQEVSQLLNNKDMSQTLTREEAARLVIYLMEEEMGLEINYGEDGSFDSFSDLTENQYTPYIQACFDLGIMKGNGKGQFLGWQLLTRAEGAVIISNYLDSIE